MSLQIKDAKPQVGIFEIIDGQVLVESEDVQQFSNAGDIFSGNGIHLHAQSVKTMVAYSNVNEEIKKKFKLNRNEYLKYPRGRVDYNTKTKTFTIMSNKDFFTVKNVELITRAFNLPPYASGKIELVADEGHYGIY